MERCRGTRCQASWIRSRSGVYGIRQGKMAGHARTIGVLTPCCVVVDDDDDDDYQLQLEKDMENSFQTSFS